MSDAEIHDAWARIVAWVNSNAPDDAAEVHAPKPDGIADLEAALGYPLPTDLAAYFGAVPASERRVQLLPFHHALTPALAAESVRLQREIWSGQAEAEPDAGDMAWGWIDAFVALTDSDGDAYFVDLRPGEQHCCVKLWDHEQGGLWDPEWPSVSAMLSDVAAALESHGAVAGWTAEVEDDRIDWTPSD